jgi:hypothetical protein
VVPLILGDLIVSVAEDNRPVAEDNRPVSYTSDAADGRAPSHKTNTRYQLRTIVEYRETEIGMSGGLSRKIGELVCECGHVVEVIRPGAWWSGVVERGKKMRCQSCPIEAKPIPKNQCAYDWATERGLRQCTTRAHWHTNDWGGPDGANLCTKHYRYLRREGYIAHPAVALD